MEMVSELPEAASVPQSRRVAAFAAAAFGLFELANAFVIEFPAAAVVFALLFGGAWLWIRHGGIGGLILLGALCAIELAFVPVYDYATATDWIIGGAAGALSALGLVAAVGSLVANRRARA